MIKDAWFQTVLGGTTIKGQVWIKYDWFGSLLKTIMRFYWCLPNFLKYSVLLVDNKSYNETKWTRQTKPKTYEFEKDNSTNILNYLTRNSLLVAEQLPY